MQLSIMCLHFNREANYLDQMLPPFFIESLSCFAFALFLYTALHFILIATLLSNEREILVQGWVEIIGFSTFPRCAGSQTQWPCFPEGKFEGHGPIPNLGSMYNSIVCGLENKILCKRSAAEGVLVSQAFSSVAMSYSLSQPQLIKISFVGQLTSNASLVMTCFSSEIQMRFHLLFKTSSQISSTTPKTKVGVFFSSKCMIVIHVPLWIFPQVIDLLSTNRDTALFIFRS